LLFGKDHPARQDAAIFILRDDPAATIPRMVLFARLQLASVYTYFPVRRTART
jgi:hypothetical protein